MDHNWNRKETLKTPQTVDGACRQRSIQNHEAPRELKCFVEGFEFTGAGSLGVMWTLSGGVRSRDNEDCSWERLTCPTGRGSFDKEPRSRVSGAYEPWRHTEACLIRNSSVCWLCGLAVSRAGYLNFRSWLILCSKFLLWNGFSVSILEYGQSDEYIF